MVKIGVWGPCPQGDPGGKALCEGLEGCPIGSATNDAETQCQHMMDGQTFSISAARSA